MNRTRRNAACAARPTINGRRLTAPQTAALRVAERAERAGDAAQARRLRLAVEHALAASEESAWLSRALAETVELERGRGGTVDLAPGRIRIGGRDGLESLRASGALSPVLMIAGLRYRDRFEAAQNRCSSALAIRPGGGRGRPDAPEGVALRIAQANRDLDRLERAVTERYAAEGRPALAAEAVLALREVAGLGRSIRDLSGSGHRRASLKARLVEALDVVAGARA